MSSTLQKLACLIWKRYRLYFLKANMIVLSLSICMIKCMKDICIIIWQRMKSLILLGNV